ncbi:MAG TPA: hypothetical protein VKB57_22445, partial [Acidimicrobiales bacterium]|nr:hypothetical protein [Acidimicrobiales bacterium]
VAAEKLRVVSVGPGAVGAGGFEVPVRESCSFCEDIAGRHGELGPPAVVVEDDLTRTLVCPITMGGMPGHTLVITRRHAETVFDLTVEEAQALGAAVAAAARRRPCPSRRTSGPGWPPSCGSTGRRAGLVYWGHEPRRGARR